MGTRAYIGLKEDDGTVNAVYCGHDGYPEHTFETLVAHYNSKEKANALIARGQLSCVHDNMDDILFYAENGREELSIEKFNSVDEYFAEMSSDVCIEYVYLFENGSWRWE